MGEYLSTPPPPEFEKPWRKTPWKERPSLEKNLRELKLSDPKVQHIRILLTGEIGSGKSSFINSVNSAFQGRITTEALANSVSTGTSFTKTYRTYHISDGQSVLPFVFDDIMGLEPGESQGAHPEDIVKCLEGLLKEGHIFIPATPKKEDCRSKVSTEDLTYCLVYVISANTVSIMNQEVFKKIRYIRQKASELEIPQAIIMTNVDEVCPLVRKDLRKIYTSKKIKEKMQECSVQVGVPVSHIFPVKNYHEEIDTENDIDVLILRALTQIVQIADDLLKRRKYKSEKGKTESDTAEKA